MLQQAVAAAVVHLCQHKPNAHTHTRRPQNQIATDAVDGTNNNKKKKKTRLKNYLHQFFFCYQHKLIGNFQRVLFYTSSLFFGNIWRKSKMNWWCTTRAQINASVCTQRTHTHIQLEHNYLFNDPASSSALIFWSESERISIQLIYINCNDQHFKNLFYIAFFRKMTV